MKKIIPVVEERKAENVEWICPNCEEPTSGTNCKSCYLPHPQGMVVIPDNAEGEEMLERIRSPFTCNDCVHFDRRAGQEILHNPHNPLFHVVVEQMEGRSVATNMNWKEMGLCRYWDGHVTCSTSPCRINKVRLDSSTPYKEKDRNVKCPAFKPRSSDGKVIESYRQVPGSRTRGTD